MKACISCGKIKPIDKFYSHKGMSDGHLNKCKDCVKLCVKVRYRVNSRNPDWVNMERARGRDKYHRLKGKWVSTLSKHQKRRINKDYRDRFPEKYKARCIYSNAVRDGRINPPKGMQAHHWSYAIDHALDVIFLTIEDHNVVHRYLEYDQEKMLYRSVNGVLLNSIEKHQKYLDLILEFEAYKNELKGTA